MSLKLNLENQINETDYDVMDQANWDQEIGVLISGNEAQQLLDTLIALETLVEAKLIKDFQGEPDEYKRLKELGWQQAFRCFDTKQMLKDQLKNLTDKSNHLASVINQINDYIK